MLNRKGGRREQSGVHGGGVKEKEEVSVGLAGMEAALPQRRFIGDVSGGCSGGYEVNPARLRHGHQKLQFHISVIRENITC